MAPQFISNSILILGILSPIPAHLQFHFWPPKSYSKSTNTRTSTSSQQRLYLIGPKILLRVASTAPLNFIQIPIFNNVIRASQLITSPTSWIEWHYCNSNHFKLCQAIATNLQQLKGVNQEPSTIKDKIYLSRSRVTNGLRTSINEKALEEKLIERGFSILHPQHMTLSELIPILSRATLVAGPVGSAMHKILFIENQDQLTTLNFCNHLANNVILIENVCHAKKNFHSFSTHDESIQGKSCLRFDIDACLSATDSVLKTL